jgi:hypothetical protein
VFCLWNTPFQRKAIDLGKESGGFVGKPKRGARMLKHDLLIFYGALAVAGCLMVVGIVSCPNSLDERSAGGRAIGPLYRPQSLIPLQLTLAPISLRSVRKTRPLPWFIARSIPTRAWSRGPRSKNSYGKAAASAASFILQRFLANP